MEKGQIKLTELDLDVIEASLKAGHPESICMWRSSISERSYNNYKNRGRDILEKLTSGEITEEQLDKNDALCLRLLQRIYKAKAEFADRNLLIVQAAAINDWKAASWLLEKILNKHVSSTQKVELTGKDGKDLFHGITDEELKAKLERLRKITGESSET